jgi:dCMP deaminase
MYMRIAEAVAETSSANRLKVGSVIVKNNNIISTGYNALPAFLDGSLEDKLGNTKPETRHSEKNALLALVKSNESSLGSILFCTHSCCKFCSIDIIDAGIKTVYYRTEYRDTEGLDYLRQNGIEVIKI